MKTKKYTDYESQIKSFVKQNYKKILQLHPNITAVGVGFDPNKKIKGDKTPARSSILLYLKDVNGYGNEIKEYEGYPVQIVEQLVFC
jgi:hypothetical protein